MIAFVGAGGKTTGIFKIAREILASEKDVRKVLVSNTSHLGTWQISQADHYIIADSSGDIENPPDGLTIICGPIEADRVLPVSPRSLKWLHEYCIKENVPLLIEADGSRGKLIKAPNASEPPIPEFINMVVVVASLSAIGKPLTDDYVFRSEIFKNLCKPLPDHPEKKKNDPRAVDENMLVEVLGHPDGGLKNIPRNATRVLLLNQAENPESYSIGGNIAARLSEQYHSILVGSLHQDEFHVFEETAGIILAAGASTRFGKPKQFLEWHGKPFVRHVAETAIISGLRPVIIVTGINSPDIEFAVNDLPVIIAANERWQDGQSSSVRKGIQSLPLQVGSAIFLHVDQPQIKPGVIRALVERHSKGLPKILAPLVNEQKRGTPVLFDKTTFPDLLDLTGDIGGRSLFNKYEVEYLPWFDQDILLDVDTPEDYQRLLEIA